MAFLLGLASRISPHAAAFMAGDAALFFMGMAAFALARPRAPGALGVFVLALVAVTPQALVFQGVVWKDVMFTDAALAAFAALALAGLAPARSRRRAAALAGALALFALASLVRQMGLVAAVAGVLAHVAIEARRGTARAAAVRGAIGLIGIVVVLVVAALAFRAAADGKPGSRAELATLQLYDLAGAAHLDPRLPLANLARSDPALWRFVEGQAGPRYTPATQDMLSALPGAHRLLPPRPGPVGRQWRDLVLGHAWLWLQVRAQVFWRAAATPDSADCPIAAVGVDTADNRALAGAGLARRLTARDQWDEDYVEAFEDGPVMSHLAWAGLAAVLLVLALIDARLGAAGPARLAAAGLLIGAAAYTACFFVAAPACDYRYLYLVDVAAMAAAVERAAGTRLRPPARRPPSPGVRASPSPRDSREWR